MSYDVWLAADVGAEEGLIMLDVGAWNYTSNIEPILSAVGLNLHECNDVEAEIVGNRIQAALLKMSAEHARLLKLEPSNGFGDLHGTWQFLNGILLACMRCPRAVVRVM